MRNIAVFLGELQLDTQRKVLEGIAEAAKADGNNVVVYCLTLSKDEEFNIGESAAMQYDDFSIYDGFIIYSESIYSEEIMAEARKEKEDMFFIFLDLDGLKKVNDALGHEMGDRMICDMADVLRKTRNKDELLMRYGGDEFVVFGKGSTTIAVEEDITRIRRAMREINEKGDRKYNLDASIGYHMVPYDNEKPLSALIELADQEMYKEKRAKHKR